MEDKSIRVGMFMRLSVNPGFAMFCVTPKTDVPENILIPLRDTLLAGDGRG